MKHLSSLESTELLQYNLSQIQRKKKIFGKKRGSNFKTSLYISWFPKQNLKKIQLKTTWKKVQEMLLIRLYLLKLAKYLHRLLKKIWCLIISGYLDVARGGVPPAHRTLSSTSHLKKKSFKIYINHLIYKLLVLYMLLQIKWLIGWVSNSRKQGSAPTSSLSVTLIRLLFAFFVSHLEPSAKGIV